MARTLSKAKVSAGPPLMSFIWFLLLPLPCRPTIFIEIIQRVGCMLTDDAGKLYQKGGCGGFGKGNFSALFKSIEEYEKTLESRRVAGPASS